MKCHNRKRRLKPIAVVPRINGEYGSLITPTALHITTRKISTYLQYGCPKHVSHHTLGKLVQRQGDTYTMGKSLDVRGLPMRPPFLRLSPESHRKYFEQNQTQREESYKLYKSARKFLPRFPGWHRQFENILKRVKGEYDYDRGVLLIILKEEWNEWMEKCYSEYLNGIRRRHIVYNGTPFWRGRLNKEMGRVSDQLRINSRIITEFFTNIRPDVMWDADEFFESEKGRTLEVFEDQLKKFVAHATQILKVDWVLRVGRLMLEEESSWVPLLVDGRAKIIFDGVASTMARLLYEVILENYYAILNNVIKNTDRVKLIVVVDEEDESANYWKKVGHLMKLAKIPRVDCKIYPKLFPYQEIDVSRWFDLPKPPIASLPRPFKEMKTVIKNLQTRFDEIILEEKLNVEKCDVILSEISVHISKTQRIPTRSYVDSTIYDHNQIKLNLISQLDAMKRHVLNFMMDRQTQENDRIRHWFLTSSGKLFGKEVLYQLSKIGEVSAELPLIKHAIKEIAPVYNTIMKYDDLPDSILRHYFEISRLGLKLQQLTDFVWKRIELEREWISKRVCEQSNSQFFEGEMMERELDSWLKKYRNASSAADVLRVASKMKDISDRISHLAAQDEILKEQRDLLSLAELQIDLSKVNVVARFIAKLAQFHSVVLAREEEWMAARILEINHEELLTLTLDLQSQFTVLEGESVLIDCENTFSLVTSIFTSIKSTLTKLNNLLPILNALSNQGMKERHWETVLSSVDSGEDLKGNPMVKDLLEMNIMEKADQFDEISAVANKELVLENSMKKMKEQWGSATFAMDNVGGVLPAEQVGQLEAHIARSQMILASPHALALIDSLKEWLETLTTLQTFIELYKQCSTRWHYVEGVFSTEDIAYQMPTEFRLFKKIHEQWNIINENITDERPILEIMDKVVKMNKLLAQLLVDFKEMESGFNQYLHKKRNTFPRFHLLNDAQLLELLSKSRDPPTVAEYIPKLFVGWKSFILNPRGELTTVVGLNEDRLILHKPIHVNLSKRHVEKWLSELERESKNTFRLKVKDLVEFHRMDLNPIEIIVKEPLQAVEMYYRIALTHVIERAMRSDQMRMTADLLQNLLVHFQTIAFPSARDTRVLERVAIIVIDRLASLLHLISEKVYFPDDERWLCEPRFYWHNDQIWIRISGVSIRSDYEYYGDSPEMPCQKAFADMLRNSFHWIDEGFGLCLQSSLSSKTNLSLVSEVARLLGRLTIVMNTQISIISPTQEQVRLEENSHSVDEVVKSLVKATLLLGAVTIFDDVDHVDKYTFNNLTNYIIEIRKVNRNNPRYIMDSLEFPLNRSCLFVFLMKTNRSTPTSSLAIKKIPVQLSQISSIASSLLRFNVFQEDQKVSRKVATSVQGTKHLLGLCNYYNIDQHTVIEIVREAFRLKTVLECDEKLAIEYAFASVISPRLRDQDVNLACSMVTHQQPLNKRVTHRLFKFLAKKEELDHPSFIEKCFQLFGILDRSNCVIIVGPTLSGKSKIMNCVKDCLQEPTAKDSEVLLRKIVMKRIFFSEFHLKRVVGWLDETTGVWCQGDLVKFVGEAEGSKSDFWIILDGTPSDDVFKYIASLTENYRLETRQADHVHIPNNVKIIIETDEINTANSHYLQIPLINVDKNTVEVSRITSSLEMTALSRLHSILKLFSINDATLQKVFFYRKIKLQEYFEHESELLATTVLVITLQSLVPFKDVKKFFTALGSNLTWAKFFENFPTKHGFIELQMLTKTASFNKIGKETEKICTLSFESSHTLEEIFQISTTILILKCGMVPLLIDPISPSKLDFINAVVRQIESINWQVIVVHVTPRTRFAAIRKAISSCRMLFGDSEGNILKYHTAVMLVGLDHATDEIVDYLREQSQLDDEEVRFIGVVRSRDWLPERLSKFLFPVAVSVDKKGRIAESFPLSSYQRILKHFAEFLDETGMNVFKKELLDAMSAMTNMDDRVKSLLSSEAGTEDLVIYKNRCVSTSECRSEYEKTMYDQPDPHTQSLIFNSYAVRQVALFQKLFSVPGCNCLFVGPRSSGRRSMVHLAAKLSPDIDNEVVNVKTELEWDHFVEKIVRSCLLDGRRCLLIIPNYSTKMLISILYDLRSITLYGGLPPRLLTQQLLSEFSEKYSLDGKAIWETIGIHLRCSIKFVIITTEHHANELFQIFPDLMSSLLVDWSGHMMSVIKEQTVYLILEQSKLFSEQQMNFLVPKLLRVRELVNACGIHQSEGRMIEMAKTYIHLVKEKREIVERTIQRYQKGMEKLRKAEEQMSFLQGELLRLQPELVRTSLETSQLMSQIERETIEVENAREVVAANENKANEAATKAQALKAESEQDLANAIPALDAAVESLQTMNQSDVSSLKTMRFPPYGVRLCMEAVCIILGERPAKVPNENGEMVSDYWVTGQKLLSDIHFLTKIRTFPRDKVSKKAMLIVRERYLSKEEFDPENIKQCSLAAEGLCLWVKAIDLYNKISKIVEPKKERLRKAEILVKQHMKQLDSKRRALQRVTEKLQGLSDQFSQMSQRKQELQLQIQNCELKMDRAERLVVALGGEKEKWSVKMESIRLESEGINNKMMALSTGIEYLSDLPLTSRKNIIRDVEKDLYPNSPSSLSVQLDNVVIIQKSRRPVLLIDPQGDSNSLLESLFPDIEKCACDDPQLNNIIIPCILNGRPLLISDVALPLPSLIFHMLHVKIVHSDKGTTAIIDEEPFLTKPGFRLFLSAEQPPFNSGNSLSDTVVMLDISLNESTIFEQSVEVMGRKNWTDLMNTRNELEEQLRNDDFRLEKIEEELLELLGRSQDLDDDRAIELLAEGRKIQEGAQRLASDQATVQVGFIDKRLASIVARYVACPLRTVALNMVLRQFSPTQVKAELSELLSSIEDAVRWAAHAVRAARSVRHLSKFYNFPLQKLLDCLDIKLLDDSVDITTAATMKEKVSSILKNTISCALTTAHNHLINCIFRKEITRKSLEALSVSSWVAISETFPNIDTDPLKEFSTFIHKIRSTEITLLVTDPEVVGLVEVLDDISKSLPIVHIVMKDSFLQILRQHISKPCWTVVHNIQFDVDYWMVVQTLNMLQSERPHSSFRLILNVPSSQKIERSVERLAVFRAEHPHSLRTALRHAFSHTTVRYAFDSLNAVKRPQFIRLLCLHLALIERSRLGIYGFTEEVHFTDMELSRLVSVYRTEFSEPTGVSSFDESVFVPSTNRLKTLIVDPVYGSKFSNHYDKIILDTMFEWFISGLNKQDDFILNQLVPETIRCDKELVARLDGMDCRPMTGVSLAVHRALERRKHENLYNDLCSVINDQPGSSVAIPMKNTLTYKAPTTTPQVPPTIQNYIINELQIAQTAESREYFSTLLNTSPMHYLFANKLNRPHSLFWQLRIAYANAKKVDLTETECFGEVYLDVGAPKLDSWEIVLEGCSIIGAKLEGNSLRELGSSCSPQGSLKIRIYADKAIVGRRPPSLPLLHPLSGTPLCDVLAHSPLPIAHWILRGARFLTSTLEEYRYPVIENFDYV